MQEPVYTCKVLRYHTSNWLAAVGALAVVFLVILFVNFMIGERELPSGLKDTNLYFFIGFLISSIAVVYLYLKNQLVLEISKLGDKIRIDILDDKLSSPLVVMSPFTMSRQWYHRETGQRGIKMKELCLTFLDKNNQPLLTIISVLGALHDAPFEWEYLNLFDSEDMKRLHKSEHIYTNGKAEEISLEINSLMALK